MNSLQTFVDFRQRENGWISFQIAYSLCVSRLWQEQGLMQNYLNIFVNEHIVKRVEIMVRVNFEQIRQPLCLVTVYLEI